MQAYQTMLRRLLEEGAERPDRTGTGTLSLFSHEMSFDLQQGFPLLTTKKLHLRGITEELRFFIRGEHNARWLQERRVSIWDEWRAPYLLKRPATLLPRVTPSVASVRAIAAACEREGVTPQDTQELSGERTERELWNDLMRGALSGRWTLDPRWLDRHSATEDLSRLAHQWYRAARPSDFVLSDYGAPGHHGPETSAWLRRDEAALYQGEERDLARELMPLLELPQIQLDQHSWRYGVRWNPERELLRLKLYDDGELGPVYGVQWRQWPGRYGPVDQLKHLMEGLRDDPYGRRHLLSAWNPGDLPAQALPACHALVQFYVRDTGQGRSLSAKLIQRSADSFLGVPYNVASYALLIHLMARVLGYQVGELIWSGGDVHLYRDHLDVAREQLTRAPRELPQIQLAAFEQRAAPGDLVGALEAFEWSDLSLSGYAPWPHLKAAVSV